MKAQTGISGHVQRKFTRNSVSSRLGVEKSRHLSYNEKVGMISLTKHGKGRAQMQQPNQQGRRFTDNPPQQPVYRFPQNQPVQSWQPQQSFDNTPVPEQRAQRHESRKRRRRILTLWNLFAVIGIIAVIIEGLRYVVIPLLVYLNTLTGGAL